MRIVGKDAFAMRVKVFGDNANALLLKVVNSWEREGIEADVLIVARSIFQRAAIRQRPNDMKATRQDPEQPSVVQAKANDAVLNYFISINKYKCPMFRACLSA